MNIFYNLHVPIAHKGIKDFLDGSFEKVPDGARVLNVGSGGRIGGKVSYTLKARGCTVESFDIDPKRQPDIVGDLVTYDFQTQYDALYLCEVLEHIPEPHKAIENVFRALKPGGVFFLSTPFVFGIHDAPHDYFRYTKYGLAYLLRNFTDVEIRPRNSWAETLNVALSRICIERNLVAKLISPIAVGLALITYPLSWLAGKIVTNDCMTSGYVVTARKPQDKR